MDSGLPDFKACLNSHVIFHAHYPTTNTLIPAEYHDLPSLLLMMKQFAFVEHLLYQALSLTLLSSHHHPTRKAMQCTKVYTVSGGRRYLNCPPGPFPLRVREQQPGWSGGTQRGQGAWRSPAVVPARCSDTRARGYQAGGAVVRSPLSPAAFVSGAVTLPDRQ